MKATLRKSVKSWPEKKKKYFISEVERDFSLKMMLDFVCGRDQRENVKSLYVIA